MTPAVLAGIMQQQKESAEVERYLYALEKPEQAMIYAAIGKFFHEKGITKNRTGVLPTQKRGGGEDKKRKEKKQDVQNKPEGPVIPRSGRPLRKNLPPKPSHPETSPKC